MHNRFEPEPTHKNDRAVLERYLNLFCTPLERDLSAEECAATRQELRAHLLLSAAAHQELGATPEEAVRAALQGFGDPVSRLPQCAHPEHPDDLRPVMVYIRRDNGRREGTPRSNQDVADCTKMVSLRF